MSAFLVSVWTSEPSAGNMAMPMLAVVWHSWPLNCTGWLTAAQQLARDRLDVAAFGGVFEDHDEFVAAEPRHDVACAQALAQPAGDFHQQGVAGFMAERIVDDLEAVEIDEQHRKLPLVAPRRLDGEMQQLVEHLAIGQPGQAVVRREIFDPLVGPGLFVGAIEIVERERDVVGQFRAAVPPDRR